MVILVAQESEKMTRQISSDNSKGNKYFEFKRMEFCCEKMAQCWMNEIDFDPHNVEIVMYYKPITQVRTTYWVKNRIDFCPFCGVKIRVFKRITVPQVDENGRGETRHEDVER